MLTILDGSTFCICDERGDIVDDPAGFYAEDTRHLSRLRLTIDGERPAVLASGKVDHFSAAFQLRSPATGGALSQDALLISRERFVGHGMQDHVTLRNPTGEPVLFELALELGADFADILTVKEHAFAAGRPVIGRPLPPAGKLAFDPDHGSLVVSDAERGSPARTQIVLSRPGTLDGDRFRFEIALAPWERWELRVDVAPLTGAISLVAPELERSLGEARRRAGESLEAWRLSVPRLRASWDALRRTYERSVADLGALRLRAEGGAVLPAAGVPWFMTVFGRDAIIASLQTLLLGPELARGTLETLTRLQATGDDPGSDAEPGKIIHELRRGKAAGAWFPRYYGTVDATPLYLVLLSELWRWTDDRELVARFKDPALRALEWIDRHGDRDGDGFVEYERRAPEGLENQSWKDSGDSQRFSDGRFARSPIAPCEVQGYVYDAKRRLAEVARECWNDPVLAGRLEREAGALRDRFDEAFWVDRRGGFYALALDRDKRRVDSLCSNIGHLLWSGIVPDGRVDAIVDRLLGEELWSGWGVRTMSTAEAAYSPLSYHNGTVWPHDNSLIAQGLARYGRWAEAHEIVHSQLAAAPHFGYELPEAFSGIARDESPFPVGYPTAAHPQAWAAGAAVLMLQVLLGLEVTRASGRLDTVCPAGLPSWAGEAELAGVRAFGRDWVVRLEGGRVSIVGGSRGPRAPTSRSRPVAGA